MPCDLTVKAHSLIPPCEGSLSKPVGCLSRWVFSRLVVDQQNWTGYVRVLLSNGLTLKNPQTDCSPQGVGDGHICPYSGRLGLNELSTVLQVVRCTILSSSPPIATKAFSKQLQGKTCFDAEQPSSVCFIFTTCATCSWTTGTSFQTIQCSYLC
jgi:hypothetical protein